MARHALLIGVSEFADERLARLNAPANDVIALRGILEDSSRGNFDGVELSLNEDFLAIRDHLSRFFLDRSPDDILLLYYSGHGILGRANRLFLASSGSNLDTPRTRSIAAQEIRDFIEESRAGRQVVVLDCCHSGAFAEHAKAAVPPPAVTSDTFSSGDTGLYVLTAADALQFAWDGPELRTGNGGSTSFSKFTSWLVEGLEKGDAAPDDEQITMDALYQYLFRRARSEGAGSTPQRFVQGGVGDLVISANPLMGSSQIGPAIMAALAAEEFRTRLGAVAELTLQMEEGYTVAARAARLLLQRHLQSERDFQVRRAITRALEQPSNRPSTAARPAEEEKQRAEVARQAGEQKGRVQAGRQVEEIQEPRMAPRNEVSSSDSFIQAAGSGVKPMLPRRSRNRWGVIAAAAFVAVTVAGGGYSLYKGQQRTEGGRTVAEATQRGEAAQKAAAAEEQRLVGTWKANIVESGVSMTIIWHIMPNHTTGYRIHSNVGDKTISGTWSYSDGVIYERASDGDFSSASVQWINDNNIVITIKDNSDPGSEGSKRYYSRL